MTLWICPVGRETHPSGGRCAEHDAERLEFNPKAPHAGEVVAGRYLVLGTVGKGGMGEVCRAW